MEDAEYRRMFEVEDRLWWYRGLRAYLAEAIARARVPAGARALDAGCGTGANLVLLAGAFARAAGCDLAPRAVALARMRGLPRTLVADVNALPFRDGAFGCVLCADVFESAEIDERRALAELARVTASGGTVLVTVAAYQWLLSEHDRAVHSVRRYTRGRARRALSAPGLRAERVRYLFGTLLLPIVAFRLLRGLVGRRAEAPRSDLFVPPAPVNALLAGIVGLERALARVIALPFGTTLLLELRRA